MLKQNRSETDDLHRTIAAKDAELIIERNVDDLLNLFLSFSISNRSELFANRRTTSSTISESKAFRRYAYH